MPSARIFRPSRDATQSGLARTKQWILEFDQTSPREIDPLMGWNGSADMMQQVRLEFDTEEEALRLANATPYGLSGSIWSRDIGKALRAAKALQAGVISVNTNSSVHTEAPFGGYKMSGIGRELGMSALDLYTETKNVFIDLA